MIQENKDGDIMFDTLLFDLDDTLLSFQKAEYFSFKKTCEDCHIQWSEPFYQRYKVINEGYWKKLEKGQITRDRLIVERFEVFFKEYHINYDCQLFNDLYFSNLKYQHQPMEHTYELLDQLKGKTLYLVTNGQAIVQKQRILDSRMHEYMNDIFISEEVGFEKPSIHFFEAMEQRVGPLDKNHTLIIGDSLSSDMLGGNHFGIQTCWYNPKHKENYSDINIDYEIDDLLQLLDII